MTTDNKRASIRRAVMKAGRITFYPSQNVTCTVRDLSKSGALLEVKGDVPDSFYLTLEMESKRQYCTVAWRKGLRLGVQFLD